MRKANISGVATPLTIPNISLNVIGARRTGKTELIKKLQAYVIPQSLLLGLSNLNARDTLPLEANEREIYLTHSNEFQRKPQAMWQARDTSYNLSKKNNSIEFTLIVCDSSNAVTLNISPSDVSEITGPKLVIYTAADRLHTQRNNPSQKQRGATDEGMANLTNKLGASKGVLTGYGEHDGTAHIVNHIFVTAQLNTYKRTRELETGGLDTDTHWIRGGIFAITAGQKIAATESLLGFMDGQETPEKLTLFLK